MTETVRTFCRICESLCGLEVDVDREKNRVVAIRPDRDHVATAGFACVKGLEQHQLYDSPDRLSMPMKRVGDRHVPISWAQALTEIGEKVRGIRARVHADAVAMYVGTAAGFSILHPVFAQAFIAGLGSRSLYSTATQDCASKFAAATHVYGFPFTQPFPDVDRTACLIVVGANPAVSKWSFLQVANPVARLKELEARGARIITIDPRRTETARASTEHHFIRPNTDVFFYLSFLHEVLARDAAGLRAVAHEVVGAHTTGFEELRAVVRDFPPERTAEVTGIDAETLRGIVSAYLAADGAALYCSTGVNMGTSGAACFWLQEVINCITGNLDRRGGTLVGQGIFDFPRFGVERGLLTGEHRSRVGNLPMVNDAFPGGVLADEILTPGERQVRALFVTGGNPLLTMPNSARLAQAFDELELLVCIDLVLNETASQAHYVLPATTALERPDLPFVFPLFLGMQSRPYLQATRAVVAPPGEVRDEASIYLDLAAACGVNLWGSAVAQKAFEGLRAVRRAAGGDDELGLPQELLLELLLGITRQPGFKKLLRHEHGLALEGEREGTFLGKRVVTGDGKVHLCPAPLAESLDSLEDKFALERAERHRLKLITRRAVTTHNSWTHNALPFVSGRRTTNYLYLHPEDAARIGVGAGELVDVSTSVATVRLPVELLRDLMPGVVALPHGWGHQRARGLSIARKTTGVNVNLLAADGPSALDPVSGMAHLTGFVVDVVPAAGPLDPSTWSGLPETVA
jgi:formate dehydrogenase